MTIKERIHELRRGGLNLRGVAAVLGVSLEDLNTAKRTDDYSGISVGGFNPDYSNWSDSNYSDTNPILSGETSDLEGVMSLDGEQNGSDWCFDRPRIIRPSVNPYLLAVTGHNVSAERHGQVWAMLDPDGMNHWVGSDVFSIWPGAGGDDPAERDTNLVLFVPANTAIDIHVAREAADADDYGVSLYYSILPYG